MFTHPWLKPSPPGQNGCHFTDDIFKHIFLNEFEFSISPKFVPKGPIDSKPTIGWDNGSALNKWQAIIWTNADPIHWRIYVTLGGDELICDKPW